MVNLFREVQSQLRLAEIIREAKIDPALVPKVANLLITLYEEKGKEWRRNPNETIHFERPIFEGNPNSYDSFKSFLFELESELSADPTRSMIPTSIILTDVLIVVHYGLGSTLFFPRVIIT